MKIRMLAVATTLAALSAGAFAQTPKTTNQAQQEMNAQKKDPLMMQESAPPTWDMLKGHEKGYISKTDVQPNTWLAANFQSCDKDSNGKVTQSEFANCQKPAHD